MVYRQKSFEADKAALYLVATPIGNLSELTPRAIEILNQVDVIAAEDTRNTMKLLHHFGISTRMVAHHQHNEAASTEGLIALLHEGKSIALVSDAGYPLISDPGSVLAKRVIEEGYPLIPVSGSNAMLNALVCSGMDTRHFMFYGFLKSATNERIKELNELRYFPYTMIFYEAPHRLKKMLTSVYEIFGNRHICLARELTKKHEEFIHGTIEEVLNIVDELKGEMVIIVEGCQNPQPDQHQPSTNVYEQINQYIDQGYSTKDAIKLVSKETGISRNDLYRQYHELN
ncbi:MAG: 16S rRNA (cytidine(1402)-2'-O)-methyltransferase [Longicatena sp.]|nr:16S rRNA (cytidine(1402)-2'-O)-methyltransferase [Longicatena sp.]